MEYSGAGGKLIHEKNQKQKISWHYPFKSQQKGHDIPFHSASLNSWLRNGLFHCVHEMIAGFCKFLNSFDKTIPLNAARSALFKNIAITLSSMLNLYLHFCKRVKQILSTRYLPNNNTSVGLLTCPC